MTPLWTSEEVAKATGGTVHGGFTCEGVTFDSREVIGGELFIAMKGEAANGHDYVASAFERGAAGAVVSQPVDGPHVLVEDGFAALEALGRAARKRASNAKIVGVTGSVGKTSVKEAIRRAFGAAEPERTHWSVKSYNNHTGVPLSLARMPADTRYGVFEMGMNHTGELSALTRHVRPHVALITAIAPAHIEFFDSEEAIADAKAEIFEGLEPGGTAIVPFDSAHYERLRGHAETHADRVLTFGTSEEADVHLERSAIMEGERAVVANVCGEVVALVLKQPGKHWISNALAALAVVHACGGDLAAAGLGIGEMEGLAGRGARHEIDWKGGTVRLLDESYNANTASMRAALDVLATAEGEGRRVAVLGAMKELGARSDELHESLAEPIRSANAGPVALVGTQMQPLAKLLDAPLFDSAAEAEDWLRTELRAGDTVLVKGSNSIGLSRIVTSLTRGDA